MVNVRPTRAWTALAVPLLLAPALDSALCGAVVVALLSVLHGSYLRLSTVTRR
ncbi:hypothetical protein ACFU7Y_38305 [Kitasatospora sp. NPDC057542]|uniref:hypothetical protein n=1 Tax=Kitasatospora sp. NPDC057542 TaxID=3346162 RepID=UPI0036B90361